MHTGGTLVVLVTRSCPTLCDPMDCSPPGSFLCPSDSPGKNTEWITIPFSRGSSQPGIEPGSPALQADSLPFERQGRPIPPFERVTQFPWVSHAYQRYTCSSTFVFLLFICLNINVIIKPAKESTGQEEEFFPSQQYQAPWGHWWSKVQRQRH